MNDTKHIQEAAAQFSHTAAQLAGIAQRLLEAAKVAEGEARGELTGTATGLLAISVQGNRLAKQLHELAGTKGATV